MLTWNGPLLFCHKTSGSIKEKTESFAKIQPRVAVVVKLLRHMLEDYESCDYASRHSRKWYTQFEQVS